MFENEIAVNEMHLLQFNRILQDLPTDDLFHPSVGHNHPPVWILGHLAISAEMGQRLLGGTITHREWLPLFGIGSSDIIAPNDSLTKDSLSAAVVENYRKLRSMAAEADPKAMSSPHSVKVFEGTPLKTVGNCVAILLTGHFAFHLAQLSSCRRTAGFGPIV